METWEKVLTGVLVLLVLLWFRPGIKHVLKESREAEKKDWQALIIPIGFVVLVVILLIALAR
ncbi:MAG: hypothetical protein V3R83_12780 [Gammaproteobacteria bacterium]